MRIPILAFVAFAASPLAANTQADPAGDFLPSFTGPQNGDLDVISITALYNETNVLLSSTQSAAVGTTPGGFYVWGVNRGSGTARLQTGVPPLAPGILLDAVAILRPDGTGTVISFPTMGMPTTTPLPAGAISISGATISGVVPLSLLPSTGFTVAQYTYNLWPRSPGMNNPFISDFAPNDSSIIATLVPEPASWALMITGFGLVGASLRRRSAQTA